MGISQHLERFAGLPVRQYNPDVPERIDPKTMARISCAYRVGGRDYVQDGYNDLTRTFPELLDQFLNELGGPDLTALVIGAYNYNDMCEGLNDNGAAEVVAALVANRRRMPNLSALFFGDITFDECEISWLGHRDISSLLPAFPKLEEFRVRGTANITFGEIKHGKLRAFAVESGGLPERNLEEVWAAKLPKLEHLELWLGSPSYGGISDAGPLEPLLSGKLFGKLKYLGLRNSEAADSVAVAVAGSAIVPRLESLDLSLGSMTDVGAEALLGSAGARKLKKLDLHHHFISEPFVRELKKLPIEVDVSEAKEPDFYTHAERTYVSRYNVASE
jgi:hypothetical protein